MSAELAIIAKLQDEASSGIRALRGEVEGLGGAGEGAGRGFSALQAAGTVALTAITGAALAAGAALVGFFAGSVEKAAALEAQMDTVAALLGATAEQAEILRQATLDLALDPNLKVSATEAAQAIEMLAQNGLTVEEILGGAARATVLLANATGADFTVAARIATDAMALWGMEAGNLEQVANGVTAVLVQSKFEVNDYAQALAQAGGVAAAVGVSFDDFNATLVAIAPYFASGSDAGTSYKTMLQRLIPTTAAAKDAMAQLGLITEDGASAFFDSQGNMRDMAEVAGLLNGALSGLSEQQRLQALSTIFGTDAMRAAAAMSQFTEDEFRNLMAVMANTSAAEIAAQRMQNFSGAMDILKGVIEGLQLMLGNVLLPILTQMALAGSNLLAAYGPPLIAAFERLVAIFSEFFANIQSGMTVWESLRTALSEIGQLFGMTAAEASTFAAGVSSVVQAIVGFIAPIAQAIASFVSWKDVLLAVGIAIASVVLPVLIAIAQAVAPVIAVFAALVLAIAALRNAFETNFLGIRDLALGVWTALQQVFEGIRALLSGDTTTAMAAFRSAWEAGWNAIVGFIQNAGSQIGQALSGLWGSIVAWFQGIDWGALGQTLIDRFFSGMAALGQASAGSWEWVLTSITNFITGTDWGALGHTLIDLLVSGIIGAVGLIGTAIGGIVTFIWNFITGTDWIALGTNLVNAIIDGLRTFGEGAGEALGEWRQRIFDWAGAEDWGGVGDKIAEMVGDALGTAKEAVAGQLSEWQTAIFDWAGAEDWQGVAEHIAEMIGEKLGEARNAIAGQLSEWQAAIFDWAGAEDWQGVAEHIAEMIGEKLGEARDAIAGQLSEWEQAIFDWAGAEDWAGVGDKIVEMVGQALADAATTLWNGLESWETAIFDWAGAADWVGVGTHIAEMVGQAMVDAVGLISDKLGEWEQAIFDWVGATSWIEVGQTIVEMAVEGLTEWASAAADKVEAWFGDMSDAISGIDWYQIGYDISTFVVGGLIEFGNAVSEKITGWYTSIQTFVEGKTWNEIALIILGAIALGLGDFADKAGTAVSTWKTDISTKITEMIGAFSELGRNIVDGIISGITAMAGAIAEAIRGIIAGALGAGEQAAGAQSPATAFMPLGSDITAGVAVGIMQNVSAVIAAIQSVAQAVELEGVKAFGEAMTAIADGVAAALSAILDIGSFGGAGEGFGAAMQAIVDLMKMMVAAVVSANTYSAEVLENLGTFVEAAEAINDLLTQTADVVDYIARWRAPDITAVNGSIQLLVGFLAQMVQGIIGLNLEAMLILGALGDFLDTALQLPELFMGVADIASYLASWRAPELGPVIDNVNTLAALLGALVTAVAGANTMGLGMLDILAAFIETAAGIVALIAPLADAMFDIANFPPGAEFSIMQANIDRMAGYLGQIVTAVAGANTMGLLSLEQLGAFVEVAAGIVDLIDPMAQAMFGIANFPQGADVQVMAHNIEVMAGYLRDLVAAIAESNSWGQLTLELLGQFVDVAGQIAALIVPMAEAVWNIANFQAPDLFAFQRGIATLAGNLAEMVVWFYAGLNLSSTALEVLGQYIEVIAAIAEGMTGFIEALNAIIAFQPPDLFVFQQAVATLAGNLAEMVVWFYAGLNLSQSALEALGQYVEVMSAIAEGMTGFIEALNAIVAFQPPDLFVFQQAVATLAGQLGELVVWFYASLNLSQAALEALGLYIEVLGDLVDLIADAIEALGLIAAYSGNTAALGPAIAAFAADLMLLVQTLAAAFAAASAAALAAIVAAGEFADAVGDILGVVEDGVDALAALAGYVTAANLVPTAQQFAADLAMVITTVVQALQTAGVLASAAIVAAGEMADGLADVLGMVEDGVSALVELANYVPNAGLVALAQRFAVDLAGVITAVVNALVQAGLLANEAVVRAGELADGLTDILAVVADGVEAITALAAYVPASGIQVKAAAFATDLATVINAIVNGLVAAGLLANQAVVAAGEMAGRLSDLLAVVADGIEAIQALAEYGGVADLNAKVQKFTSDLIAVATVLATQLTAAANAIGVATIDAARGFATAVTALAGEVQAAVTGLAQLAGMATPNVDGILAYIVASAQQIQTAFAAAGDIGQAVAYAAAFRANLTQLVAEVQAAVAQLNALAGTGTTGSIGAALANIAGSLQNTAGQFAGAGTALANALITTLAGGIGAGQGQVWGTLEAVLGNSYANGLKAAALFGNVGKEIADTIAAGIGSGQAQVVAAVTQVVGASIAAGITAARAAAAIGQQIIQSALTEMNNGRGQLDSAGAAAGNALIDGMVRAITTGKSRLVSSIIATINAAIAAAKAALGIASPSKVAIDLLSNFMNTAARTVEGLRGKLAGSMAAAVSGAATAAAAGLSAARLASLSMPAVTGPALGDSLAQRVAAASVGRGRGGTAAVGVGGSTQVVFYGNVVLPNVVDSRSLLEELDALRGVR